MWVSLMTKRNLTMRVCVFAIFLMLGPAQPAIARKCCPNHISDHKELSAIKLISKIVKRHILGAVNIEKKIIEKVAKSVDRQGATLQTIIVKSAAAQAKAFRNALVGHRAAQDKVDTLNQYGPPSRAPYGCCDQTRAAEAVVARDAVVKTRAKLVEAVRTIDNTVTTPESAKKLVVAMDPAVESAQTLFPASGTIAVADMIHARDMTRLLTNPTPTRAEHVDGADSVAGIRYAADRRIRQARIAVARQAVADIVAAKAPTHNLSAWSRQMQVAGGKDATAAAAAIPAGLVSADTVLNTLVAMRYESPNWAINLHALSTEGLLRESLMMEAVQSQIALRNLRMLEKVTVLLATQHHAGVKDGSTRD